MTPILTGFNVSPKGKELQEIIRIGIASLHELLANPLLVAAMIQPKWTFFKTAIAMGRPEGLRSNLSEQNQRLAQLATHDPLTAIPNRWAFFNQAQLCLQRATAGQLGFAMVLIDIKHFQLINEKLGHAVGDAVLVEFADSLRKGFAETGFVARLGGDEFGVLLEDATCQDDIDQAMTQFCPQGTRSHEKAGHMMTYKWCVGCAVYPDAGADVVQLYEVADAAVRRNKRERQV
jgi:diguanylate cyclase (GGDEF)-like protein